MFHVLIPNQMKKTKLPLGKRMLIALAFFCGSSLSMHAQLLYKVTKGVVVNDSVLVPDSVQKPSYVVASCRLLNPMGTISQVGELKNALTATDQVYFEVNKSAYANTLAAAKKLENGKTLLSLLTPAQQAKLNAFLKKYMEVDFRSSYVQKKYGNLTPAALLDDLEQLLFVANHMGKYDPTHTFDQYFEAQAKANGEFIGGLADVDSYVHATYQGDLKQQVDRLVKFLENEQVVLGKMNKMVDAFTGQDLDAASQANYNPVDKATLEAWTTKMTTVMAEKPTLFVIDAGSLGGPEGMLQMLRNSGYIVEGEK